MRILAKEHAGMRVNGLRYLNQTRGTGYTFMRQQMAKHLEEMARRYYLGEITVVDEFLQLYCIGEQERSLRSIIEKEAQPQPWGDDQIMRQNLNEGGTPT